MPNKSVKNDASPDGFDGASLTSALPDNRLISRINISDDLGSAEKMTESAITIATNTSSDICASRAASSASVESANEMENAKSEPKEPRASAIAKIAGADESYDENFAILPNDILIAISESVTFHPKLFWQSGSTLMLRRLLLAPRKIQRGRVVRKMIARRDATAQQCVGVVFGCSLANLMHYARGSKHKVYRVMREIRRCLEPVSAQILRMSGKDRAVLSQGIASHRVVLQQQKKMREIARAPPIDSKMGHAGVVLGITAALLVVFTVLAADAADATFGQGLSSTISTMLFQVADALRAWRLPACSNITAARVAIDAEMRAVQRAIAGVRRAGTLARQNNLDFFAQLKLELKLYALAAWPPGMIVEEETHDSVMEKLLTGALDLEALKADGDFFAPPPGVVPLSALPNLLNVKDGGSGSDLESVTASSVSSMSSSFSGPSTPNYAPDA